MNKILTRFFWALSIIVVFPAMPFVALYYLFDSISEYFDEKAFDELKTK